MALRGAILILALLAFWAGLVQKACRASTLVRHNSKIEVSGLVVGSVINFSYYGTDLSRVTLSVEDSIGKILHFELRHNEECLAIPSPEILLNTKIDANKYFDADRFVDDLPLKTGVNWKVIAEEDGFLIENENVSKAERFSHKFLYRSPHQLSDVHKIQMYAKPECGTAASDFTSYIRLNEIIPIGFTKISFEGAKQADDVAFEFYSDNEIDLMQLKIFDDQKLHFFHLRNGRPYISQNVIENYSIDDPIECTIEKLSHNEYQVTINVRSAPDKLFSYRIVGINEEQMSGLLKSSFTKFTKLEIV